MASEVCFVPIGVCVLCAPALDRRSRTYVRGGMAVSKACFASVGMHGLAHAGVDDKDLGTRMWWYGSEASSVSEVCFMSTGECALECVGDKDEKPRVRMWRYGGEMLSLSDVCFVSTGTRAMVRAGNEDEGLCTCTWWCGGEMSSSGEVCFVSAGTRVVRALVSERMACVYVRGGMATRGEAFGRGMLCSGRNACLGAFASKGARTYVRTLWCGGGMLVQSARAVLERAEDATLVPSPSVRAGRVVGDTKPAGKAVR